jgi:large subunit ribosomal protein L25
VASEVKIAAESRAEFGKGAARRIRRAGKVPGVLYGHGQDPVHISLPGHELMLALKTANVLLSVDLNGDSQLALPKQVQRDPIRGFIDHVDLILVRRGEKVTVDVRVLAIGDVVPDALVSLEHTSIPLAVEATHIPESVVVDISGLPIGSQVLASDLKLPEGAELAIDPDALVVNVFAAPTVEELEADLAEAAEELGIEEDQPTETDTSAPDGTAPAEGTSGGPGDSRE